MCPLSLILDLLDLVHTVDPDHGRFRCRLPVQERLLAQL
jgi:hypothetical protein